MTMAISFVSIADEPEPQLRERRASELHQRDSGDSVCPLWPDGVEVGDWWRLPNGDIAVCVERHELAAGVNVYRWGGE